MTAYNMSIEGSEFLQEGYVDKKQWQTEYDAQSAELEAVHSELLELRDYLSEDNQAIVDNFSLDSFKYINELEETNKQFAAMRDEALAAKEKKLEEERQRREAQERLEQQQKTQSQNNQTKANSSSSSTMSTNVNLKSAGVVNWGGYRFTWYSQNILPGGGLSIPGRYVNGDGFVCDGDGYIVAATAFGRGTVGDSPWGAWKSYDTGVSGNTVDLYTSW